MTISIPATDTVATNLNTTIANLTTLITNNASNGPLVFALTKAKANAQLALVLHLLGEGRILAANILTNETYTPGQSGGDQH
jgi:prophage tail gpP-like protein